MSPCMERITQRSSTISAWCGNRSETSMPDLPYFLNVRLQPEDARLRIDVLILDVAELGRALLPVELVEQRLGVERFQVRRAARHEQEDARLSPWRVRHVRRLRARAGCNVRRARLVLRHHGREGERAESAEAVGQKLAAIPVVTNVFGAYQFTYRNAFRLKTARANSFSRAGSSGFPQDTSSASAFSFGVGARPAASRHA